jgi:hypothetical protein
MLASITGGFFVCAVFVVAALGLLLLLDDCDGREDEDDAGVDALREDDGVDPAEASSRTFFAALSRQSLTSERGCIRWLLLNILSAFAYCPA